MESNINQGAYNDILTKHFHPWFTKLVKLVKKADRGYIFQEEGDIVDLNPIEHL